MSERRLKYFSGITPQHCTCYFILSCWVVRRRAEGEKGSPTTLPERDPGPKRCTFNHYLCFSPDLCFCRTHTGVFARHLQSSQTIYIKLTLTIYCTTIMVVTLCIKRTITIIILHIQANVDYTTYQEHPYYCITYNIVPIIIYKK